MASSQNDRLRRSAQKAARRKLVIADKRKAGLAATPSGLAQRIRAAGMGDLLICAISQPIFEIGMGQVIVARSLSDGQVGLAIFLIDTYCRGVKEAYFHEASPETFAEHQELVRSTTKLEPITASRARQLIDEATAYAARLGFPPARDLAAVRAIFGDAPPSTEPPFIFGHDGKPLYIASQHDTPVEAQRIRRMLERKLGSDGFHFVIPVDGPGNAGLFACDDGMELEGDFTEVDA